MKKKSFALFLVTIAAVFLFPTAAYADMGPKPSVRITFENMGEETCYGTLLSRSDSTGPYSVWDGEEDHIYNYDLDREIWEKFVQYQDQDGYYYLQTGWLCSKTKELNWTYHPPKNFKILLYYPDSDTFLVSGSYERYAFDSYYTVDMAGIDPDAAQPPLLTAERNYDFRWELISLACRIVLTILLELCIALLFGFRSKNYLLTILCVNIVTQVILNVLLGIINYQQGSLAFTVNYILFELIVFAIEAVVYNLVFDRISPVKIPAWKLVLYALAANAVSFAGGFLVAKAIPGIF